MIGLHQGRPEEDCFITITEPRTVHCHVRVYVPLVRFMTLTLYISVLGNIRLGYVLLL